MPIFSEKKGVLPFLLEAILVSLAIGLVIPFVFLLRGWFTGEYVEGFNFVAGLVFSFTVSFCIYFFNVRIVNKIQQHEKKFNSQILRVTSGLLLTMSLSAFVMFLVYTAFIRYSPIQYEKKHSPLFDNIIIAIVVNVIVVAIKEVLFFIRKWKLSIVESEQLRRQTVESQYAALSSQINPHFLFNSLNVLSSLIQTDPAKAVIFTREFARIYRYVLEVRDKLLVTVKEELDFMQSYLYLQQIRFDAGLVHRIEVDSSCLEKYLPPLSLQLLLENAIKHNEISEENPLTIEIHGSRNTLTVLNNYQPIRKNGGTTGLGLKNLTERYAHFTDEEPVFKIDGRFYQAVIPLLQEE